MENVLEKEPIIEKVKNKNEEKKYLRISGITFWRIFAYFIIYSFLGYIVETLFGVARYGVLESRKSFLYGPFCAIYGLGSVIMIVLLQPFKKSHSSLFLGGTLAGSVIEYVVSWIGETFLHLKWWDYSNRPFNINGRICLLYSFFWGGLALILIISVNPKVDQLIDYIKEKISIKTLKTLVTIGIIFLAIDCVSTAMALFWFTVRTTKANNIEVQNQIYIDEAYDKIYNNEFLVKIINNFFNDEKMLTTFPRLTIQDSKGNIIKVRDLYPNIRTDYFLFSQEEPQ